jgi:hypothetical protein
MIHDQWANPSIRSSARLGRPWASLCKHADRRIKIASEERRYPFVWSKTADQILAKTNRQTTSNSGH